MSDFSYMYLDYIKLIQTLGIHLRDWIKNNVLLFQQFIRAPRHNIQKIGLFISILLILVIIWLCIFWIYALISLPGHPRYALLGTTQNYTQVQNHYSQLSTSCEYFMKGLNKNVFINTKYDPTPKKNGKTIANHITQYLDDFCANIRKTLPNPESYEDLDWGFKHALFDSKKQIDDIVAVIPYTVIPYLIMDREILLQKFGSMAVYNNKPIPQQIYTDISVFPNTTLQALINEQKEYHKALKIIERTFMTELKNDAGIKDEKDYKRWMRTKLATRDERRLFSQDKVSPNRRQILKIYESYHEFMKILYQSYKAIKGYTTINTDTIFTDSIYWLNRLLASYYRQSDNIYYPLFSEKQKNSYRNSLYNLLNILIFALHKEKICYAIYIQTFLYQSFNTREYNHCIQEISRFVVALADISEYVKTIPTQYDMYRWRNITGKTVGDIILNKWINETLYKEWIIKGVYETYLVPAFHEWDKRLREGTSYWNIFYSFIEDPIKFLPGIESEKNTENNLGISSNNLLSEFSIPTPDISIDFSFQDVFSTAKCRFIKGMKKVKKVLIPKVKDAGGFEIVKVLYHIATLPIKIPLYTIENTVSILFDVLMTIGYFLDTFIDVSIVFIRNIIQFFVSILNTIIEIFGMVVSFIDTFIQFIILIINALSDPLKAISLIIAMIIWTLLYIVTFPFNIPVLSNHPIGGYIIGTVLYGATIIKALFLSSYNSIMASIMTMVAVIVYIFDVLLCNGNLTRLLYRYILSCENHPSSWYLYPSYHENNKNTSFNIFCYQKCGDRKAPRFGGIWCQRLRQEIPSYCGQAMIMQALRGINEPQKIQPSQMNRFSYKGSFGTHAEERKRIQNQEKYIESMKWYNDRCHYEMKQYDYITKVLCMNPKNTNLHGTFSNSSLKFICQRTYCTNSRYEPFCIGYQNENSTVKSSIQENLHSANKSLAQGFYYSIILVFSLTLILMFEMKYKATSDQRFLK